MPNPLYLDEMTPSEISRYIAERPALLLPLGAIEPHGDHLPVATDTICTVGICETLSRELGLAIAPPLAYGHLDRMVGHPGALTLSVATYSAVVEELLEQFARAGFRFVVVCNGHGPNNGPIVEAVRRVVDRQAVQFLVVEWYKVAAPDMEPLFGDPDPGHGGVAEVAAVTHYRPELVHLDRVTTDSFGTLTPGVLEFPLQKTANAADPALVVSPEAEKMRKLMVETEWKVVEAVRGSMAAAMEQSARAAQ